MTHDMKENKLGWREGYKVRGMMYKQNLVIWISEWRQNRREQFTEMWGIGT